MQNPKFQIFKSSANQQYYFRLKAKNGENILSGEGYTSKKSCLNGIQSVKTNSPYDSRYEDRKSVNGQYYFNLKASNGEIIGTSEMYTTSSARDNGKAAVKRDAPGAGIEDLT
ncbi:YegP family protein [Gracilimonas sediminicola]|uniref:YegP family protein n=1 Tax=Gracilimonas sediminicola TaxID=2952158 RepID=UPI0038D382DE